jgi:ATP-dependent Zn protease
LTQFNEHTLPFSVVFLRINISTYYIEQLDIYYSYMQDFSTEMNKKDEALPHLKIKFTNINTKPKAKSSLVSLVTYLKTQNNLLKPTGSCIGYELIDNRL